MSLKSRSVVPEDPWKDAYEVPVTLSIKNDDDDDNDGPAIVLQMVGITSPTHTVFGRLVAAAAPLENSTTMMNMTIQDVVTIMVQEIRNQGQETSFSATELLQLGSVWRISSEGTTGKSIRSRVSQEESTVLDTSLINGNCSLRVHFRPSRFPSVTEVNWAIEERNKNQNNHRPSAIVYQDLELGFTVVNKPSGLPSHATVDNAVENVLYQIEERHLQYDGYYKPSLPQRLDVETSGLLLVASRAEFSSYIGKLLERKTTKSLDGESSSVIKKQYKCLVEVSKEQDRNYLLERIQLAGGLITHYMDPNSKAPKTFSDNDQSDNEGWLKCLMRVRKVGPCMMWRDGHRSGFFAMEVEIDLLTGRTHQIRGQMAAMNLPLVGDPLYGHDVSGSINKSSWNVTRHSSTAPSDENKLALQCCYTSFPKPEWAEAPSKKSNKRKTQKPRLVLIESSVGKSMSFRLDKAWWTDKLVACDAIKPEEGG